MPVTQTPWSGSVTLTNVNQNYSLQALLTALPETSRPYVPTGGAPMRAQYVAIQADPDGGAAKFYITRTDGSATDCGVEFYPTQVWPIYSVDSNLIRLDQIYLRCDTAGKRMNVCFITR